MYASELRTYALGSIVCVLLGGASGFGWHHFVDTTGARVVGSAATPSVRQDASNSPAPNPSRSATGSSLQCFSVSGFIPPRTTSPTRSAQNVH